MRNCQRWSEGKVTTNGVYEIRKWRLNSKKRAEAKIWLARSTPPPDSSLIRKVLEEHRPSGLRCYLWRPGHPPQSPLPREMH